jgi:hypothetical protein
MGPIPSNWHFGFRYYILFTDEFSRFTWIYFLTRKSEVVTIFEAFKQQVENALGCTIRTLQIDGGTEFKPLLTRFPAITYWVFCPYTPEQNGLAERKHRHIVELGLATLLHAHIPQQHWPSVFESVVFVINRLPAAPLFHISPYQKLFDKIPDYSFLRAIGCLCFPLLRPYAPHKLAPRSQPCVFIGYSTIHKGYKCLDLTTNRVYISCHVVFDETIFPF